MIDTLLFAGFALAYVGLLVRGSRLAVSHGWWTPANLPLLVVLGLIYDNSLLALGRMLGEGTLLESLSLGRYWMHAFLTPLLVVFAWHASARAASYAGRWRWIHSHAAGWVAAGLTAALVVLELVTVVLGLRIEPHHAHGVLSYSKASASGGPPLMVVVIALVLLAAGAIIGRLQSWWWFLAGAVVMTLGSAVILPVPSSAVTNACELVLLTSILATKQRQDGLERPRG